MSVSLDVSLAVLLDVNVAVSLDVSLAVSPAVRLAVIVISPYVQVQSTCQGLVQLARVSSSA